MPQYGIASVITAAAIAVMRVEILQLLCSVISALGNVKFIVSFYFFSSAFLQQNILFGLSLEQLTFFLLVPSPAIPFYHYVFTHIIPVSIPSPAILFQFNPSLAILFQFIPSPAIHFQFIPSPAILFQFIPFTSHPFPVYPFTSHPFPVYPFTSHPFPVYPFTSHPFPV